MQITPTRRPEPFARAGQGFACMDAELGRWFGAEGYELMVARAVGFSRGLHPLLDRFRGRAFTSKPLSHLHEQLSDVAGDEAADALVQLLATFIALLDRLVGADLAARMIAQTWWNGAGGAPPQTESSTRT